MIKNNILVIEKVTWFNILSVWSLISRAEQIYLSDEKPSRFLSVVWNFISRKKKIMLLKDVSDPEALGKAGSISLKTSERIWEEISKKNKNILSSLMFFFKDENASFAYKQKLILNVEQFLSTYFNLLTLSEKMNSDVIFIAKNPDSFRLIELIRNNLKLTNENVKILKFPSSLLKVYSGLSIIINILFPFYVVFYLAFTRSIKLKNSIKHFKAGCPNAFGVKTMGLFPNDIFLIDGKNFNKENVAVLLKHEYKNPSVYLKEYADLGIKTIDLKKVPVTIGYLLKLFQKLMLISIILSHSKEYFSNKIIMQLINDSLKWNILLQSYMFNVIWSNEDRNKEDTITTIMVNQYGIKHILIPHYQLLKNGSASSYFHYNSIILPGNFMKDAYAQTWSKQCAIFISGIPYNDNLQLSDKNLASDNAISLIHKLKTNNKKIISVFSGSYQGASHSNERYLKLLKICMKIIELNSDVSILLKPKVKKEYFKAADLFKTQEFNKIIKNQLNENIFILDPREGYATSASYLIKNSEAVISISGDGYPVSSVWSEALMLGKPSFAYNPPFIDLPLVQDFKKELIFSDENDLLNAITLVLRKKWKAKNKQRLRHLFDPFCDHNAINRIINILKKETKHY